MNICIIDFETYDPYIKRKLGAGWAYKLNVKNSDFKILCAAVKNDLNTAPYIVTNMEHIKDIVSIADILVMHNASYDLGCLLTIGVTEEELKTKKIYDTEVMARLYDNTLTSYSLDALAKHYFQEDKGYEDLALAVLRYEQQLGYKLRSNHTTKDQCKFAYENMDKMWEICPNIISEYALLDIDLTEKLFNKFKDVPHAEYYSRLALITNSYRAKGTRIDLKAAKKALQILTPKIIQLHKDVYEIAEEEFNIKSIKDVPRVFDKLKIKYPKTAAGNPSITTPWLEQQNHKICQAIVKARKYKNIADNFIRKIIYMQEYTLGVSSDEICDLDYGKVYPELNLLRAKTGRFSSSNPNIQQIPSRDEELAPICRSLFVADEGESWFSLDYSNQEGRLQVHYAYLTGCGAEELVQEFLSNPELDMHQKVADMAQISRTEAKTINLGLSYGMGINKLAKGLGLAVSQAKDLKAKYEQNAPYLTNLKRLCENSLKTKQKIRTLGERNLKPEKSRFINGGKRDFYYKALNMLIQGSAADQLIKAMVMAYDKGLNIKFPVHDQLCLSGTQEDAKELKHIMETCVTLSIPSVVDVDLTGGRSWADAGH